ncbi:MAG: MauE/DoxX family redox-associated membrane protein [Thermoanaerobaculia bacterium]
MRGPLPWRAALLLLIGVFGAAFLGKVLAPADFVAEVEDLGVPTSLSLPAAAAVMGAELAICLALVLRRTRAVGVVFAGLALVAFTLVTAALVVDGRADQDCGCFGSLWKRRLGPTAVLEDAVLCVVALWTGLRTSRDGRPLQSRGSESTEIARSVR